MALYLPAPPRPLTASSYYAYRGRGDFGYTYSANGSSSRYYVGDESHDIFERRLVEGRTRNRVSQFGSKTWKPCTSYRRSSQRLIFNPGVLTYRWKSTKGLYDQFFGTGSVTSRGYFGPFMSNVSVLPVEYIPMSQNTYNRLSTEILQKIGDRKVSYGESLAESREALNHLSHTASTFVKLLLAVRKGHWAKVPKILGVRPRDLRSLKSFSSRWLEYQYAWMPLINDIYDTHKLLTTGFRKEVQLMSSVRRLTDHHEINGPFNWTTWQRIGFVSGSSQRTDIMKVYYKVKDSDLAKINQMGLLNPVDIAWAVVPYSFVVDWFLPVGNFLEACTATIGCTFIDGYYSTFISGKYTTNPPVPQLSNSTEYYFDSDTRSFISEFTEYKRTKLTSFPVPALYVKSPFSTSHVVSALALINQLRR